MKQKGKTPHVVGWWNEVTTWCLGANDRFGTCAFAALGNLHALVTTVNGAPEVMMDAEIMLMDHDVTGFDPMDPSTDHGALLVDVLKYWETYGWAGDPTLKPAEWHALGFKAEIPDTIALYGGVYAWCMLPMQNGTEDEPDFSDTPLRHRTPGTRAHAVLIVGATDMWFWIVTWGQVRVVSKLWWEEYGRDSYAVLHPAWHPPGKPAPAPG